MSYAFDGGCVWACRHHPELRVAGIQQEEKVSDVSCDLACSPCTEKRVEFADPLVEQLIEFEVESITISTSQNAKGSRCVGRKYTASLAQPVGATRTQATRTQARKRREEQSLKEMPDTADVTLSKAVPISAEAVRKTQGRERELWKSALESELTSLEDNRVFYKVSSERALELQRAGAATVPARLVLVLKPDGAGVKRKARIVACGNFIGQYETYDVSNLDAAVFQCVLQMAAKRKLRVGVVDIRTAFLHAGIEPGRVVIVKPPGLLKSEAWVLCKALYGLRESPGLWAEHRDPELGGMTVVLRNERYRWLQGLTHGSVWMLVKESERERIHNLRRGQLRDTRDLESMAESDIPNGLDFPVASDILAYLCVYVDDLLLCAEDETHEDIMNQIREVWKTSDPKVLGLGGATLTWRSHKQSLVALSTGESELYACIEGLSALRAARGLLLELGHEVIVSELLCDNSAAICLSNNDPPMRSRHWSMRAWRLREAVRGGEVVVSYIQTDSQRADSFTKALSCQAQQEHRKMMGLVELQDE
eukprot:1548809-Amphidinium_carterae.1